jgi:hypothetical protein
MELYATAVVVAAAITLLATVMVVASLVLRTLG